MKTSSPWRRGFYAPWPLDLGFSRNFLREGRPGSPIPARTGLCSVLRLLVLARNLRRR